MGFEKFISIHTLVKRVTVRNGDLTLKEVISIHTLVKRVTLLHLHFCYNNVYFNSHSRKESDGYTLIYNLYSKDFNSHSRKESDAKSFEKSL